MHILDRLFVPILRVHTTREPPDMAGYRKAILYNIDNIVSVCLRGAHSASIRFLISRSCYFVGAGLMMLIDGRKLFENVADIPLRKARTRPRVNNRLCAVVYITTARRVRK